MWKEYFEEIGDATTYEAADESCAIHKLRCISQKKNNKAVGTDEILGSLREPLKSHPNF